MRALSLAEVIKLHEYVLEQSGGITGIRDLGALESAVAQPHMTFGGVDLYQTHSGKGSYALFFIGHESPIRRWQQTCWSRCNGDFFSSQ